MHTLFLCKLQHEKSVNVQKSETMLLENWCSDGSRETLYVSQVVRCSVSPGGADDAFFISKFSQNWLKPVR
jgi:hypothetical protein